LGRVGRRCAQSPRRDTCIVANGGPGFDHGYLHCSDAWDILAKGDAFLVRASSYVYRREVNKAIESDVRRFDLNPELPKFQFQTLVITGRYDFNVAPSVAWRIHSAIPGSRWAVFENSGHLPFFEERDQIVRVVEEFLAVK